MQANYAALKELSLQTCNQYILQTFTVNNKMFMRKFLITALITATGFSGFEYLHAQERENWSQLSTKNACTARHEAAAVAVGGKLYLLGGRGLKVVEVFDPKTSSWQKKSETPLEFHHFQAVPFRNKIYIIGAFTGRFPHETPVPNVYIYDPATDSWTKGAEIPEARRRGAAGLAVHADRIYLAGGSKDGHWGDNRNYFDEYNPLTNQWKSLPDMPRVRDHFQAVVVGGKLYAVAGRQSLVSQNKSFELTYPEVDAYDFASGKWQTLPATFNLPTPRAGNTAISYGNGFIVVGGESNSQKKAHDEVEYFDPEKGWTLLSRLTIGRHGTQAARIDNTYYIAAGCAHRGGTPEINDMEVFVLQ